MDEPNCTASDSRCTFASCHGTSSPSRQIHSDSLIIGHAVGVRSASRDACELARAAPRVNHCAPRGLVAVHAHPEVGRAVALSPEVMAVRWFLALALLTAPLAVATRADAQVASIAEELRLNLHGGALHQGSSTVVGPGFSIGYGSSRWF